MTHKWAHVIRASAPVALTVAIATAACAATAGSSAPTVPNPVKVVNQFQKNGGVFPGYRRNHAKGVCISGYFESTGKAAKYSVAQVFAPEQRTPVIGRLSIPGTSPYAWDSSTPIRGMALDFKQADGQQWRTAMNAVPAFPVATPEEDYQFMEAQQPLRATGDPDPKKLAAFFASHPAAKAFRNWDQTTRPSASYATERYNSLDAFELVDANGRKRAVRWSMVPEATADGEQAPVNQPDYLAADLRRRLSKGPIRWRLEIIFANPGDPVDNAARAWPTANHRIIDGGTLVIRASRPQRVGRCHYMNFDPLVLPRGIEPSDDPLLQFRREVYAVSHRRQVRGKSEQHAGSQPHGSAAKPRQRK